MKKLAKIMGCAVLAGIVFWSTTPSTQQNSDYMGPPGPKSIILDQPLATNIQPESTGITLNS